MYRIVGFEVDPRSVSINSLEINSDKQEKTENKKIEPGSQCVFPQQVEVAELQKGSELFLISYVYCTAVRLPDYCNSIFWMLLPALSRLSFCLPTSVSIMVGVVINFLLEQVYDSPHAVFYF